MASKINKRFCYEYLRWSSAGQTTGDSEYRQTKNAADYLKTRTDLQLSDRQFIDPATSAHAQRKQRTTKGNALELTTAQDGLQEFLNAVKNEELPPQPCLLIEGLDRFSRDEPYRALATLLAMIEIDIEVVFIKPTVMVFKKGQCNPTLLFQLIIEISTSHAHSKNLSDKLGDWWERSRKEQRAVTHLPAWLDHRNSKSENRRTITSEQKTPDQKYVVDERKAAAVRLVFELCVNGMGHDTIVQELIRRKVAPIVRITNATKSGIPKKVKWSSTYVSHLLTSRSVMGYYTPRKGKWYNSELAGPERIEYPEIISPELFEMARQAMQTRSRKGGKRAVGVNLFNGVLFDLVSGIPYWRTGSVYMVGRERLQTADKSCRKFPAKFLEQTIINLTSELNAAELQPERKNLNTLYAAAQNELIECQLMISHVESLLAKKKTPAMLTQLAELEEQREQLQEALKQTRQAEPFADQFAEYVAAAKYANGTEQQRQQLSGLLRRVVKKIGVAVCTQGYKKPNRSFVARIEFITGEVRYVYGMQFHNGDTMQGTCKFSKRESEALPQASGKEWAEYAELILNRELVVKFTKASA